jgi:hypothetical protein
MAGGCAGRSNRTSLCGFGVEFGFVWSSFGEMGLLRRWTQTEVHATRHLGHFFAAIYRQEHCSSGQVYRIVARAYSEREVDDR